MELAKQIAMLEAMVSVVLEEGYMTKGDGQNLTAFYFKTENKRTNKMTIIENDLDYETYIALRKAVGWKNFCREQVEQAINHSYYSVVIRENGESIAMGRIIGDGLFIMLLAVIATLDY